MEAVDRLALKNRVLEAITLPSSPGQSPDRLPIALFWDFHLTKEACAYVVSTLPSEVTCVAAISRLAAPFASAVAFWARQQGLQIEALLRLELEDLPDEGHLSESLLSHLRDKAVLLCDDTYNSGHNALRAVRELASSCNPVGVWAVYDNDSYGDRHFYTQLREVLNMDVHSLC